MAQALDPVQKIVVVGGGSAGWIIAGTIAARHANQRNIEVSLIESSNVGIVGVGEGTWPTMKNTLMAMGVSESDFIRECDASFKQGSKFVNWNSLNKDDYYYHPFSLPQEYRRHNLVQSWDSLESPKRFEETVCFQGQLCDINLAPKQNVTPEYAFVGNYGYHLDANKFTDFLRNHCTHKLNVKRLLEHIEVVDEDEAGYISSLKCQSGLVIDGDLFIDCSGMRGLLIDQHYGIKRKNLEGNLFINRALAAQVPYAEQDPIASCTISTAQKSGWIWDIGLSSRRGVGHVYSSAYMQQDEAEEILEKYILSTAPHLKKDALEFRSLAFEPGYREKFWHKNCVAVGMSSGFLEPLEASALVLIELSAGLISDSLPENFMTMDIVSKRYNDKFKYHWECVVDFLKLHYVLSQRDDSEFWIDNRDKASMSELLAERLSLWKYHIPWHQDFDNVDEIFSSASYQYVLYGMNFETNYRHDYPIDRMSQSCFEKNENEVKKFKSALPTNRELIDHIKKYGLKKVGP